VFHMRSLHKVRQRTSKAGEQGNEDAEPDDADLYLGLRCQLLN
jgi:hypothetical protein